MKTLYSIILILILTTAPVLAQHRWGIVAGPNLSSLHDQDDFFGKSDPRVGFNVGGIYELELGQNFSLQTELSYTLAGSKGTDMHYMMLPVTISYAPIKWLKAGVGPQGGILLGSNSDFEYFRTFDGGIQAGVEFMLKQNFSIHLRNYFGLVYDEVDFSKYYRNIDGNDPLIMTESIHKLNRNNILQINVRFYFHRNDRP